MTTGANGHFRRAQAIPCFVTEKLLYQAILQGMKGYGRQKSSGRQEPQRLGQGFVQTFQLLIDNYAQGLESSSSRVEPLAAAHWPPRGPAA